MSKIISGYLWAFKNYNAGAKSVGCLKKFYPDADIFINVDYDGDTENYKDICEQNGYIYSRNRFQLGYCGDFGNVVVGRECWPKEESFEWLRGIYEACIKTDSKYMMLLEEDDFVLNELSILKEDFSMAIHPTAPSPTGWYRANYIPNEFILYINNHNGNPISPGYAAGGGTIFSTKDFVKAWEENKNHLWENYDSLKKVNKIIGWADYILQFVMQLGGYQIIQNQKLCEHWEVKEDWDKFEIVTGMKDMNIINRL